MIEGLHIPHLQWYSLNLSQSNTKEDIIVFLAYRMLIYENFILIKNPRVSFLEKPQITNINFPRETQKRPPQFYPDKGLPGTVVNQSCMQFLK